ncbi:MAG: methyl-accepting chemotaxis protein, partial [Holophagae bacterium]|nr:methyl-accepting chemotaxis protein [Holophagae bacterium]
MRKRKGAWKKNSHFYRYSTVILTIAWGILFFFLLLLPTASPWLRWAALFTVLFSFPLAGTLNRQRREKNLAPLSNAINLLNAGDLEHIAATFLSDPDPEISSLHQKLIQLVLNIQGLLGHLDLISGNIAGISHSVNEQLVTYIRDVKSQIINTDVTLQSADEIHDFMESISADISRLSEISQETLSFLKEIVESNENVSLKMESLSAYTKDTENAMGEIITHTEKVTQNTENLASMVMETSASIMEMDATISEIQKQARQTEIQAEETGQVAKEGLSRTREASKTVESAGIAFGTVSKTIRQLKTESMKIGKIVTD